MLPCNKYGMMFPKQPTYAFQGGVSQVVPADQAQVAQRQRPRPLEHPESRACRQTRMFLTDHHVHCQACFNDTNLRFQRSADK